MGHAPWCMLWSARTCVCVCVCVRLSGVATNLGRGKYGERRQRACLGARERARGKRKGRERQGIAGERKGRDGAGVWRGAHVLYDVTCHVEVSQQQHARPPCGRTTQTRLCTCYVAAPREAVVRATARDWNGTCQTLPAAYSGTFVPRWSTCSPVPFLALHARAHTHTGAHADKLMPSKSGRQLTLDSLHRHTLLSRQEVLGGCMARLQNLKSMHAQRGASKAAASCERASCDRGQSISEARTALGRSDVEPFRQGCACKEAGDQNPIIPGS